MHQEVEQRLRLIAERLGTVQCAADQLAAAHLHETDGAQGATHLDCGIVAALLGEVLYLLAGLHRLDGGYLIALDGRFLKIQRFAGTLHLLFQACKERFGFPFQQVFHCGDGFVVLLYGNKTCTGTET
ncbi:hypothetical protein DSECCO2_544780 [anaerobic digester metagenome]